MPKSPSVEQSENFEEIYQKLNRELFNRALPPVILQIDSKAGDNGCVKPEKASKDGNLIDVILLHPQTLHRPLTEIYAVIARLMVSVWQFHVSKKYPSQSGYCNKEWVSKMREIGLITASDTPSGTGWSSEIEHSIDENGKLYNLVKGIDSKVSIFWVDRPSDESEKSQKQKSGKRSKYICPKCGLNAWAKTSANLGCFTCNLKMTEE
jgi:hypothetical protein